MDRNIELCRPACLPDEASACLDALVGAGLGETISLGGALGLLHYLDYRATHDMDAWWSIEATADDRRRVIEAVQSTLSDRGQVRTRSWGEVVSIELEREGKTVFSVQIASRSAQLEPAAHAPGTRVLLDSFPDLVASKMVALVERGAPRDFRDVHADCHAGLTAPAACWSLWERRQALAGSDTDRDRARLAVETHLARIAQHRPLEQIQDPARREEARRLRSWFATELLDALSK